MRYRSHPSNPASPVSAVPAAAVIVPFKAFEAVVFDNATRALIGVVNAVAFGGLANAAPFCNRFASVASFLSLPTGVWRKHVSAGQGAEPDESGECE